MISWFVVRGEAARHSLFVDGWNVLRGDVPGTTDADLLHLPR
jgi:hypothetical protein